MTRSPQAVAWGTAWSVSAVAERAAPAAAVMPIASAAAQATTQLLFMPGARRRAGGEGVGSSWLRLIGCQPTRTSSKGTARSPSTWCCRASRVSATSTTWLRGTTESPSRTAPSQRALSDSPARSQEARESSSPHSRMTPSLVSTSWPSSGRSPSSNRLGSLSGTTGAAGQVVGRQPVVGVVVRPASDFGDDLGVAFLQPVRPRHHEVHAEPVGHVGDGNGVSAVVVDGPHQDVQPLVRHRPRGETTPVGAALLDGAQVRSRCREAGAAGVNVTRARRAGSAASGRRATSGISPDALAATRRWCSAAPQLMTRSRPVGSAAANRRDSSAYSSMLSGPIRHAHGWVLCTLGARTGERHEPTGRLDREADGRVHARAHRTLRAVWKGPLPGRDVCTSMGMPLVVVGGVLLMSSSVEAAVARP